MSRSDSKMASPSRSMLLIVCCMQLLKQQEFQHFCKVLLIGLGAKLCIDVTVQFMVAPLLCLFIIGPLLDNMLAEGLGFDLPFLLQRYHDELLALRLPFLSAVVCRFYFGVIGPLIVEPRMVTHSIQNAEHAMEREAKAAFNTAEGRWEHLRTEAEQSYEHLRTEAGEEVQNLRSRTRAKLEAAQSKMHMKAARGAEAVQKGAEAVQKGLHHTLHAKWVKKTHLERRHSETNPNPALLSLSNRHKSKDNDGEKVKIRHVHGGTALTESEILHS